jgi:hypothetical protein
MIVLGNAEPSYLTVVAITFAEGHPGNECAIEDQTWSSSFRVQERSRTSFQVF